MAYIKNKLIIIFLFLASLVAYGQTNNITHDNATPFLEVVDWYVTDIDSAETAHSDGFGAEEFINSYLRGNQNLWQLIDSTAVDGYFYSNHPFAEVYANGTGSIDSLSLVTLSGMNVNGSWVVFDTLATNKSTAIRTEITLSILPFFTQWRIDATGADLTASGYDIVVRVKLICPKRRD